MLYFLSQRRSLAGRREYAQIRAVPAKRKTMEDAVLITMADRRQRSATRRVDCLWGNYFGADSI